MFLWANGDDTSACWWETETKALRWGAACLRPSLEFTGVLHSRNLSCRRFTKRRFFCLWWRICKISPYFNLWSTKERSGR